MGTSEVKVKNEQLKTSLLQEIKSLQDFIEQNRKLLPSDEINSIDTRLVQLQSDLEKLEKQMLETQNLAAPKPVTFSLSDIKQKSEDLILNKLITRFGAENIIKECDCCENLKRSTRGNIRDSFDDKIVTTAIERTKLLPEGKKEVTMMFVGSGNMKALLTASEKLIKNGIQVNWIIIEPKLGIEIPKENVDVAAKILAELSDGKSNIIGKFQSVAVYNEFLKGSNPQKNTQGIQKNIRSFYEKFPKANSKGRVDHGDTVDLIMAMRDNDLRAIKAPDMVISIDLADDPKVAPDCIRAVLTSITEHYRDDTAPNVISAQKDEYRKVVSFSDPKSFELSSSALRY